MLPAMLTNQFCPLSFVLATLCGRCAQGKAREIRKSKMFPFVCVCVCALPGSCFPRYSQSNNALIDSFPKVSHVAQTKDRSCLKNMPSRFRTAVSYSHRNMFRPKNTLHTVGIFITRYNNTYSYALLTYLDPKFFMLISEWEGDLVSSLALWYHGWIIGDSKIKAEK